MWTRVASFEGGDLQRLRELQEQRTSQGESGLPDGVKGTLVLVDQDGNRRQFITFFDSREAIEAVEQEFEAMSDRIPDEVRGRRTSVDYFEVAFQQLP